MLEQVLAGDVTAQFDVAEEAEALVLGGLVVGPGHRLDLRMVGSHARPDEPIRRRQAVIEIDRELRLVDGQQLTGGVEAAGSSADDGDTQGSAVGHERLTGVFIGGEATELTSV